MVQIKPRIIFSDIDGTLAHPVEGPMTLEDTGKGTLTCTLDPEGIQSEILALPISNTGQKGYISTKALALLSAARSQGFKVVLISGARTSTILERLPWLPVADAVVTENGGRIWYTDGSWQSCLPMREDTVWRKLLSPVTGPLENDGVSPHSRIGPLWDQYRKFDREGLTVDAKAYATAFRVAGKLPGSATVSSLVGGLPEGLVSTINLGKADVYPVHSGKANAALHIAKQMGADIKDCAFLCDDDNDIDLAKVVGKAYMPTVAAGRQYPVLKHSQTGMLNLDLTVPGYRGLKPPGVECFAAFASNEHRDSIRRIAEQSPSQFFIASKPMFFGTEQAIETLLRDWGVSLAQTTSAAAVV